jgi:hypothetical protein
MIAMTTSNSTNVNAREALIEFALRRMSMSCHSVLIFAKHFFQDSACRVQWNTVSMQLAKPVERACLRRSMPEAKIRWNWDERSRSFDPLRLGQPRPNLTREIEIRAAHEVMAARATQLALLVDQLMTALRTPVPMFAGNVFVGWRGTGIGFGHGCFGLPV